MRNLTALPRFSIYWISTFILFAGILMCGAVQAADNPIRIAILGDRTGGEVPGIFGRVAEQIKLMQPDLVLHVGDIIEGGGDSLVIENMWREYDSLVASLGMPVYGPAGNHDIWDDLSERAYARRYGAAYSSVDLMGIHIVMLDNSRWEYESFIDEQSEQIQWLIDDLEKNQNARHIMVMMHIPYWYDGVAENKPDTLHKIFAKYGVTNVFTGHYHEYFTGRYDNVAYTGVGSSGGGTRVAPTGLLYHFMWVTVDDDGFHIALIKNDAVLPWDHITAADRKAYRPIQKSGLVMIDQPLVSENMTVSNARVGLLINNSSSPVAFEDTIRWNIPDGWHVEPPVMPVTVAEGDLDSVFFEVSCDGHLFPAPSAGAVFNYAESKTVPVEKQLYPARLAVCNPADNKIKIDGDLKEKCWQNSVTQLFGPNGGATATEPAEFFFAYDSDNLYLAAKCTESMIDSMSMHGKKQDGPVYGDDCIGYFIAPDFALDTFYQIYINPAGVVYDVQYWTNEWGYLGGSLEWNGEYEIESKKHDDSWSIEIKMPLSQFGMEMAQGKKMRVNFRRKQPRLGDADWQTPVEFDAATFGHLIMR